jgi:hypothetical protein
VVERGPEKAGVGGSIPSLATTLFLYLYIEQFPEKAGLVGGAILFSARLWPPISGSRI